MIELILQWLTIEKPPPSSHQGREEVKSQITPFPLSFKHILNHNQARFLSGNTTSYKPKSHPSFFDFLYIVFVGGKKTTTYFKSEIQTVPLTAVNECSFQRKLDSPTMNL